MIPFICLFLLVWALYTACGLGLYLFVGKGFARSGLAPLALCAAFGLGLLGWTATWVFYLSLPPVWTVGLALALSASVTASAVLLRGRTVWSDLLEMISMARRDIDLAIGGAFVVLVIFGAGYKDGFGQPFRLGIDEVGYGTTANYLARGGTKEAIEKEVLRATEQPTFQNALNAHVTILSFTSSVAAEFLLKAHRFTYPMILAGTTKALGLDPLIKYQFCMLAVPLLCACFLLVWFCSDVLRLPLIVAKGIALAFALNCNQLIVLYEGQHAQIVILPFLVLFFGLCYDLRSQPWAEANTKWIQKRFALVVVATAAIFQFYSDAFFALGAFGVVLLALDILSWDRRVLVKSAVFGVFVICGMLVLGLYFLEWGGFMLRNLENIGAGNGGFWQPHWAYPSDIVGYTSIYKEVVARLLERSFSGDWAGMVISGYMLLIGLSSGFWKKRSEFCFWCAPILVCVAVWIRSTVFHTYINYGYYKVYTLLLVPLLVLHFGSLYSWAADLFGQTVWGRRWATGLTLSAICVAIWVGLNDSIKYREEAERAPVGALALRKFDEKMDLSRYAILTYPAGGIDLAMLGGYIDFNWLNLGWSDLRLHPALEKEIAVLVVGKALANFEALLQSEDVMFKDADLVLLRTGKKLADLKMVDLELVADKPTTAISWPHAQEPVFSAFLNEYLRDVVRRSTVSDMASEKGVGVPVEP